MSRSLKSHKSTNSLFKFQGRSRLSMFIPTESRQQCLLRGKQQVYVYLQPFSRLISGYFQNIGPLQVKCILKRISISLFYRR